MKGEFAMEIEINEMSVSKPISTPDDPNFGCGCVGLGLGCVGYGLGCILGGGLICGVLC